MNPWIRLSWLLVPLFGCAMDTAATDLVPSGEYRLVAIGGVPLNPWPVPTDCFEVPAASVQQFTGQRWVTHDSARPGPKCPDETVRVDSGHFRMVGDTIELFAADARIGVDGLILKGLVHGDTLTYWVADLDPGDFVYVRSR